MARGLTAAGSTRVWRQLRAAVLIRDGHACQVPLANGQLCLAPASHADHILPKVRGGQDTLDNLRAACAACNLRRGADPLALVRDWSWT